MKIAFVKGWSNKKLLIWWNRVFLGATGLFLSFLLLNWIFPLPDRFDYSTVVLDEKGEVIHAFLTRDQQWRMKTDLNEISPLLRKTIIEKEDRYFYYHPGVNQ